MSVSPSSSGAHQRHPPSALEITLPTSPFDPAKPALDPLGRAPLTAAQQAISHGAAILGRSFCMAFQPIVDTHAQRVFAYEALARGPHNEPASTILQSLSAADDADLPVRNLACNLLAVQTAGRLHLADRDADLFLNMEPHRAADLAHSLRVTVDTAAAAGVPLHRLVLELTETDPLDDPAPLLALLAPYRAAGLRLAIDDFGAGYSGLVRLATLPADIVKLDIALIRDLPHSRPATVILQSLVQMCRELNLLLIAEGVERPEQQTALEALGIHRMQGNLFSPPALQSLPTWPPPTP